MSFSDQDEPAGSRRRRGRRRSTDDYDDFWGRDNGGTPGRGRKRGDAPKADDPSDVSDLAGGGPTAPSVPARRRGGSSPRSGPDRPGAAPPPAPRPPIARPPGAAPSRPATPAPARRPVGAQAAVPRRRRAEGYGAGAGDASPSPARPGPLGLSGSSGLDRPARGAVPGGRPHRDLSGRPGPRAGGPATGGYPSVGGPPTGGYPSVGGPPTAGYPGVGGPPGRSGPRSGPVGPDRPTEAVETVFTDPGGTPRVPGTGETPSYRAPGNQPGSWPAGEDYSDDHYGDDAYYDEYDGDDYDGDDAGDLPRRRGCRAALIALAVLVVVVMVAGWFGWSWVQGKIDPSGGPGERVLVEIPEGTSTSGIGRVLADAGVISDATVWNWYTKLRDVGSIQAGSYEMRLNSSFTEAVDDLDNDPLPPNTRLVTIPEGLTQAQLATRLTDPEKGVPGFTVEGVQAALADPASRSAVLPPDQPLLEGTLFPETYAVEEGDTEAVVIQRMVAQFDEVARAIDLNDRAPAVGRTPYEVLIVASMVEREAGTVEDRPKVARVIYNRLAAGEALGIDATSCYEKGEIPCELTTAELEDNTAYDTRYRTGLTPTPIASPGRASIEAALAPAEGDWKWYVLDAEANDGSSYFTNDYDDFLAAKERCRQAGLGCG